MRIEENRDGSVVQVVDCVGRWFADAVTFGRSTTQLMMQEKTRLQFAWSSSVLE
jgi:hypothetical protein